MKKIIYYIFILPIMLGMFIACNDNLEEENHSNLTQDFLKTPRGFQMGLNSAYARLRGMYSDEGGIHGLMNPGTDEIKSNLGGGNRTSDIAQYHLEKYNTANEYPQKLWTDAYADINTLNFLIENAGEVDVSTSYLTSVQRDQYLGEAKFLRAFNYFNMVQQFGDVTLTTSYNSEPKTSAERHDMLSVYEVIISDLLDAIDKCAVPKGLESGRASKATARHLLAKVYLTLGWVHDKSTANYPDNPHNKYYNTTLAKEYYQKAYDVADKLISDAPSLGIKLMPDFAEIFNEENDAPSGKNTEELFVARMDWDDDDVYGGRSTLNHYYINGYDAYLGERNLNDGRCYSWNNPNTYAYDAFTLRDIDTRYKGTFQTVWKATKKVPANDGDADRELKYTIDGIEETFQWRLTTIGDTAIYYPGYKMTATEIKAKVQNRPNNGNKYIIFTPDAYNGRAIFPTITKFLDKTRAVPNDNSDRSYIIFRLGETYLLAAEAAFKNNDLPNAVKHINTLRERARNKSNSVEGDLDIQQSDVTLDFILEERTRELFAEHFRWADLVRTGTLLDRVKLYDEGPAKDNIQKKHWLRPIPRRQIERVTTGTPYPQNSGW